MLSAKLAQALSEIGGRPSVSTLVDNPGANLQEDALSTIVDRFGGDSEILEGIARRTELPMVIVDRIITRVSEAAREYLAQTYGLPSVTGMLTTRARDKTLMAALEEAPRDEVLAYVTRLQARGQLNAGLVIRSIRGGHLFFAQAALSRMSGRRLGSVMQVFSHGTGDEMDRLLDRAGIPANLRRRILNCLPQGEGSAAA